MASVSFTVPVNAGVESPVTRVSTETTGACVSSQKEMIVSIPAFSGLPDASSMPVPLRTIWYSPLTGSGVLDPRVIVKMFVPQPLIESGEMGFCAGS